MKSNQKRIHRTITMNAMVHDKLDDFCNQNQVSVSKIIEQLVSNFLLKQRDEKEVID